MELEHEQLVKGVNKMQTGKKEILLVEHLIGTEKREKKIHLSEYMTGKW